MPERKSKRGSRRKSGEMADFPIERAMKYVRTKAREAGPSTMQEVAQSTERPDPFRVLIGTILSLRTQDKHTEAATRRLFELAETPRQMLELSADTIAETIHPVGFYNTKAVTIREICRTLLDEHGGEVPDDLEALCALKGVGRKTANLTLGLGFGKPSICVDTHVHRICNRWGYVDTREPDETEMRLRENLPADYWIPINEWLVRFGQTICTPQSPRCSECGLREPCARRGVTRSR